MPISMKLMTILTEQLLRVEQRLDLVLIRYRTSTGSISLVQSGIPVLMLQKTTVLPLKGSRSCVQTLMMVYTLTSTTSTLMLGLSYLYYFEKLTKDRIVQKMAMRLLATQMFSKLPTILTLGPLGMQ